MADKGIRPYINAKFLAEVPNFTPFNSSDVNARFRATVIGDTCEQFGITHASGATAYNEAKKQAFKLAETNPTLAEQLKGLGRPPEKNNGGRKPKTETAPVTEGSEVVNRDAEPIEEQQTVFTVKKKSDGTVVAEGLSLEDAKKLVEKAAAAKKAKLYWV